MFGLFERTEIPSAAEALPGRDRPLPLAEPDRVTARPMRGPCPEGLELATFGMGCFDPGGYCSRRGTGASCVMDPVAADGMPA